MNRKVLLVDDDPNILQGYKRHLRKLIQIETATSGKEGLAAIVNSGPFAVIVSDMQMPEMDGIQFLTTAQQIAPKSVRLMLTGNADQRTAIEAVNNGHVFRFLTKPCSLEDFAKAIEAGIEQYQLIISEKELLTGTLTGCVNILTDVLSMVNPKAFGNTIGIRRLVRQICERKRINNSWEIEIAAMLSQIGCITIPEEILTKLSNNIPLSDEEKRLYQGHPQIGYDLIEKIPRLKKVAEIIAYQQKRFDGSGAPDDKRRHEEIPLGSRVLKIAIDVLHLLASGKTTGEALYVIKERKGWYDPFLIDAVSDILNVEYVIKSVRVHELEDDMILDENIISGTGEILVARNKEVTPTMRKRLEAFSLSARGVKEPIRVRCTMRAIA